MTFKEFCDKYPDLKVTYKEEGSYYFLVEENYNKFIYHFNIDKVLYIKDKIVDGEVTKVRFRDIIRFIDDYAISRSIKYETFLNLYNNLRGQIIVCTAEGRTIIPTVDDLHNYKNFYINGDRFCFSGSDKIVELFDPVYDYNTYTKSSFEDSISVDDLLR